MKYAEVICGHEEYRDGHCAHMTCPLFISNCPLHSVARTGTKCSISSKGRFEWLVEARHVSSGLTPDELTFHVIVVAQNAELAFILASRACEEFGRDAFTYSAEQLIEVVPNYLWHIRKVALESDAYEVRRLKQVPPWTEAGPVSFQCLNAPYTAKETSDEHS